MEHNPSALAPGQHHFLIDGPTGTLEIKASIPESPHHIALICHPNPQQEGTMDNKVVHMCARGYEKLGAATFRFNYRGVGQSGGSFGETLGECDDALCVAQWIQARFQGLEFWCAGFSFGAYIAAVTAQKISAQALVSIAPAVHLKDYSMLRPGCPWVVIRALDDELVNPDQIQTWVQDSPLEIKCIDFEQCGHFFHGKLVQLRQCIEDEFTVYC